ncbi:hypothetical protein Agub_g3845 [Astrephomene gubernaculifera]|uniref:Nuclear cap-binding protein subunit 1 n=1 Tax=Astrephomene gubernaculifera TaxID=47775 RepID=A0AAD3DKQ5_9CHLO|nr:hypothetical protein Agub_g3845 [Astrephomene gubernaculifera]
MDGGRGGGPGAGGSGYQRSYIGGKRGREEGPEGQPPKLSPQHLLVAKLLGVCDRNTGSARDSWTDERFFDDLLKSCRRDLEHGGDNVAWLLVEAAVEVSFKTQHYALVLGILNTERPDFSRRVTSAVIADLRDCLAAPDPSPARNHRAKQLLRFLAALHAVNVVPAEWLLAALTEVTTAAADGLAQAAAAAAAEEPPMGGMDEEGMGGGGGGGSAAASAVQPWSDFLVYSVLAALPWCGRDLAAAPADVDMGGEGGGGAGLSLAGLLARVESYMAARPVAEDEALRPMMGARSEEDLAARSDSGGASFLTELWSVTCECRDNAWEVQVLPGPHGPYLEKLAAAQPLEGLEPLQVPHWPPGIDPSLPAALIAARVRSAFPPRGGIRLLSREYLEGELPGVERLLVEEYVRDTLEALSSDRTACVLTLSGALPHHLAPVFGPQRATVRNFVAEALFSQMLRLPSASLSHAAYCTLLVDLCKVPHFQFARALSSCVRELFGCMPYLDPELRCRLASWLSYHLSSFSYQWPWDRWQWVAERPPHDPQRGFVALLLSRLLRLADYTVGQQGQGQQGQRGRGSGGGGGGYGRRGAPGADSEHPDLLEEDPETIRQQEQQNAAVQQQHQQQQQGEGDAAAGTAAAGGAEDMAVEGGGGGGQGGGPTAAAAAAPWAGDPVAETAARLVVWCRQEGSGVAAVTRARSLRPEQVAALWSSKVVEWMQLHGRELAEQEGPLAAPKVLATLLLAMGVKSPSHLHVAVERYAEAVRATLAEADADAAALGALTHGSWEATAAALGASPGQVAMMEMVRYYHSGEPQRLLLLVDRLLALHVMEGPSIVAALFADAKQPQQQRGAGRRRRGEGTEGEGAEEEEDAREEAEEEEASCALMWVCWKAAHGCCRCYYLHGTRSEPMCYYQLTKTWFAAPSVTFASRVYET